MVHVYGGSGSGATMVPEGKDNIKDEACLVCKRNGVRTKNGGKAVGVSRWSGHSPLRDRTVSTSKFYLPYGG